MKMAITKASAKVPNGSTSAPNSDGTQESQGGLGDWTTTVVDWSRIGQRRGARGRRLQLLIDVGDHPLQALGGRIVGDVAQRRALSRIFALYFGSSPIKLVTCDVKIQSAAPITPAAIATTKTADGVRRHAAPIKRRDDRTENKRQKHRQHDRNQDLLRPVHDGHNDDAHHRARQDH